jgi:hypothetical protein
LVAANVYEYAVEAVNPVLVNVNAEPVYTTVAPRFNVYDVAVGTAVHCSATLVEVTVIAAGGSGVAGATTTVSVVNVNTSDGSDMTPPTDTVSRYEYCAPGVRPVSLKVTAEPVNTLAHAPPPADLSRRYVAPGPALTHDNVADTLVTFDAVGAAGWLGAPGVRLRLHNETRRVMRAAQTPLSQRRPS